MEPDELADALLEARRYVRTQPDVCTEMLWATGLDVWPDERHARNVMVGIRYIQVDPEVIEGYLHATAFELRARASACAVGIGSKSDVK